MKSFRWKRPFVLFLCALMVMSSLPALGTESFPFIGYAAESLTLRREPSSDGAFLLTIPQGDALAVNGADGSYYIVEYASYQGYVLSSQMSRSPLAADAIAATPKPADSALTAKYPPLSNGSSGEMVSILQRALKELNYYKGTIDGKFGRGTAQAVEALQTKNKLPKNGIADAVTQQLIYEGKPLNAAGRATGCNVVRPIRAFSSAMFTSDSSTCASGFSTRRVA